MSESQEQISELSLKVKVGSEKNPQQEKTKEQLTGKDRWKTRRRRRNKKWRLRMQKSSQERRYGLIRRNGRRKGSGEMFLGDCRIPNRGRRESIDWN